MFLLDGSVVTSPSDLTTAAKCEFAFARQLDAKLGLIEIERVPRDPLEARAAELGDEHENRWLAYYRANKRVVEIERPSIRRDALREAARQTEEAFRAGTEVVFQATFFDESDPSAPIIGFADFIVRQPDGRYRVQDTKLARSVKVTALLQLAAYYDQLTRLGIPADETVELILGTDEVVPQHVNDILPVYRKRKARLREIVEERAMATTATQWGDHRYAVDGRCEFCEPEVEASRDLLLVAGMRLAQRSKLIEAGIVTIDQLAVAQKPEGMTSAFESLRQQAALQLQATGDIPPFVMFAPELIGHLPAPDPGDIFFDFEGDPLYREEHTWGLDYLWGLVDRDETFTAFWAHDFDAEKRALEEFLAWVVERRQQYPNLHIYHYASYERTHLLTISARHGVGEHIVDDLLRDNVLVDLYPLVKKTVRVGGRSYSIKKLEPLYMGEELRESEVANAAASIEQYDLAMRSEPAEQTRLLETIADYNRYDCVSTLRLHEWLLARARELGVHPGMYDEPLEERLPFEPSVLAGQLDARALREPQGPQREAFALAAAAVDYHRRENKSFWWDHFARLEYPVDEWQDARGVFLVTSGEVVSDWFTKTSVSYRTVRLKGEWAPGSSTSAGEAFTLYDPPGPYRDPRIGGGLRLPVGASNVYSDDDDPDVVYVTERCPGGQEPWARMPLAIVPGPPPRAASLVTAIETVGARLCEEPWPKSSIGDILRRLPSRTKSGQLSPADGAVTAAVVTSILDLDDSYLAVQGPPGTGKTTLAANVIATLVRDHGWRIGVVAQSHKVVENVLRATVKAGLDPNLVAKAPPTGGSYADEPFFELQKDTHQLFAQRKHTGYVMGGTAWDMTNTKRIGRLQFDLLVIDEAGQFSLAATAAVSVSARNLLLLGDPQQLPQVSQGTHPAPVDQSALGFIADGHAVLPPEYGYFLAESWRMHSAVTAPVSALAYDGALRSAPSADARMLVGVAPGLHPLPVQHHGNATHSVEEAAHVAALVEAHLGRDWNGAPLTQDDIIVVTPYNAQVECIRLALADYPDVRVGTVDKFQGQEAVISIVSLAASTPDDVPRGLDFLLSRNRLNVAISRAQWAAYLLHSPELTDFLPHTAEGVADLSRFIRLVS